MLSKKTLEMIENLSGLEKQYCFELLTRLKNLNMRDYSDSAVCAVASAPTMPIKK
ncbi:hypothetical protein [Adlercreutzia sp. ZJ304]|uniref:hypothetical protein n=1 Tax=Adlercreutzia sp. ZJ304 TaxID=2709791 RepID=UPI0013EAC3CC|nr:hypothetical protein [Adlercreutzia sp. ZJ304]